MAQLRVKQKYEVTLPPSLRRRLRIGVGDLLDAKVEGDKITLSRHASLKRGIAESFKDFEKGRAYGPFDSAGAMIRSLRRNAKSVRANKRKSPVR